MPDTPATSLHDDLAEANWHRHRGDYYSNMARLADPTSREHWLNRASVSYALASVITITMKDEDHG